MSVGGSGTIALLSSPIRNEESVIIDKYGVTESPRGGLQVARQLIFYHYNLLTNHKYLCSWMYSEIALRILMACSKVCAMAIKSLGLPRPAIWDYNITKVLWVGSHNYVPRLRRWRLRSISKQEWSIFLTESRSCGLLKKNSTTSKRLSISATESNGVSE